MANSFQEYLLASRRSSLPKFQKIVREFPSLQGIPDFVGMKGSSFSSEDAQLLERVYQAVGINALSILSLCNSNRGRGMNYLLKLSAMNASRLNKLLQKLVQLEALRLTKSGNYKRTFSIPSSDSEIWSFELKLHDWRRALFQTAQSKSFAHRVIAVFPYAKRDLIQNNIEAFKIHGIGAMLFDTETKRGEFLAKPRLCKPSSNTYALYAYSKFASQ
jgi:hypothetical protein